MIYLCFIDLLGFSIKQGRKRPLDTPKRMIERRERAGEIKRKGRLITKIMTRNYEEKLSAEIMTRNYQLVYYRSENVGIIGILAYPKRICFSKDILMI